MGRKHCTWYVLYNNSKYGHLGLFEAKHVCVSFMGGLDTPTLFSGLNAWIVVFDVA